MVLNANAQIINANGNEQGVFMRALIAILIFVLLLGCVEQPSPAENVSNVSKPTITNVSKPVTPAINKTNITAPSYDCKNNSCVAVAYNVTENITKDFYFRALAPAGCGKEVKPEKLITKHWTMLKGSIGVPNPCYVVDAKLHKTQNLTTLNITTRYFQTQAVCSRCAAAIPWIAEIISYNGSVEVNYNGRKVYSDIDVFCGQELGNCIYDYDCVRDGCNKEFCKSRSDPPVSSDCEWKDCYDPNKFGLRCGCVNKKCKWKK